MREIKEALKGIGSLMEGPEKFEPRRGDAPGLRHRLLVGAFAVMIAGAGVASVWGLRTLGNVSSPARPAVVGTPRQATVDTPCPAATSSSAVRLDPRSGAPGSTLDLSGFVPSYDEAGDFNPNTVRISFWWGLGQDEWIKALSSPGDPSLMRLADVDVTHRCSYTVQAVVPDVPPGQYPITGVYFSNDGGAAALRTETFTVTAG